MKLFRRLCCAFCLSTLCCIIFSGLAAAEDDFNYDDLNITLRNGRYMSDHVDNLTGSVTYDNYYDKTYAFSSLGSEDVKDSSAYSFNYTGFSTVDFDSRMWKYEIEFSSISGNALLSSDKVYDINISGIYHYIHTKDIYDTTFSLNDLVVDSVEHVYFWVIDSEGTKHYFAIDPDMYKLSLQYNTELSIFLDLTNEESIHGLVTRFGIDFYFDFKTAYNGWFDSYSYVASKNHYFNINFYYGFSSDFSLNIAESVYVPEDDDSGIINGIINGIGGFFDDLGDGLSGIGDSIANFPSLILEGIEGLFVPDQEEFADIQDRYDLMLRDRLGALYAGFDLTFSVVEQITSASPATTVRFPEVSVPLSGETFTFGGYDVEVVPSGYEILSDSLKIVVSIVCTLAFINALKNRFLRLFSGGGES